jgi:hypothetical protein
LEEGGLFRDEKPETWVELYQPCYVEKLRVTSVARDAEPRSGVKQTPVIRDLVDPFNFYLFGLIRAQNYRVKRLSACGGCLGDYRR